MITIVDRPGAYSHYIWGYHHGWVWGRIDRGLRTVVVERVRDGQILWSFTHQALKLLYIWLAAAPDGSLLAVAQTSIEPGDHPRNDRLITINALGFHETAEPCRGAEPCAVAWNGGAFVLYSRISDRQYLRLPLGGPRKELDVPAAAIGWQGILDVTAGTADDGSGDHLSWFDADLRRDFAALSLLRATRRGPVWFGQEASKADRLSGLHNDVPFLVKEGLGLLTHLASAPNGEYGITWANPTNHPETATVSAAVLPPFPAWAPAVERPPRTVDPPTVEPLPRAIWMLTEASKESERGAQDGVARPGNAVWSTYAKDDTRLVHEGADPEWAARVPAGRWLSVDFDTRGDEAAFNAAIAKAREQRVPVGIYKDGPIYDDWPSWVPKNDVTTQIEPGLGTRCLEAGVAAVHLVQAYLTDGEGEQYQLKPAKTRIAAQVAKLRGRLGPVGLVPRADDSEHHASKADVGALLLWCFEQHRRPDWSHVLGLWLFGSNRQHPTANDAWFPEVAVPWETCCAATPALAPGMTPIGWPSGQPATPAPVDTADTAETPDTHQPARPSGSKTSRPPTSGGRNPGKWAAIGAAVSALLSALLNRKKKGGGS